MTKNKGFVIIIISGLVLGIAIISTVGITTYHSLNNLVNTVSTISQPNEILKQLKLLGQTLGDSEKIMQAYSITEEEYYLSLYADFLDKAQDELNTIRTISQGEYPKSWDTLDYFFNEKERVFNEFLIIKQQRENNLIVIEEKFEEKLYPPKKEDKFMGEIESIIEAARAKEKKEAKIISQKEMELMDQDAILARQIRQIITEIEQEETSKELKRAEAARVNASKAARIITGFSILAVFLTFFLLLFIMKYIHKSNVFKNELIKSKEQTEKLSKIKEEFMANMSHEIRTPMNVIMGFTEQLLKPERKKENELLYLTGIHRSTEHLLRLINDLLDYSKIESGKLSIEAIGFKWKEIASDIYLLLKEKAENKNISLTCKIEGDLPDVIIGDPVRLKQILLNLTENAIKFTPKGKVEITCSSERVTDQYIDLKIEIKDTGIGIPKEKLDYIFEEFCQANTGITRKFGGSGLGLTISKRLVELQGGKIKVESKEGKGSVFFVIIPYRVGRTDDLASEQLELERINRKDFEGKKVLVVDDEEFNRHLAKIILEQWKVDVTVALNGREALDLIAVRNFDAVLMDIQIPELNGLEAVKEIRKNFGEKGKNLVVIALTANARKEDAENYLAAGMSAYLSKPFKEHELIDKLNTFFSSQPLVREKDKKTELKGKKNKKYDLDELKKITRGDEKFLHKIVEMFIANTPQNLEKMQEALENKNWNTIGMIAHKMRPSYSHFGMDEMAEKLKEIEAGAGEEKNLEKVEKLTQEVLEDSQKVITELEVELHDLENKSYDAGR
jgi:signal transduction histidine kinase/CheY-like chemotaxis protein/HPt (histidine-containing phosphotransfer) domain-containing protein